MIHNRYPYKVSYKLICSLITCDYTKTCKDQAAKFSVFATIVRVSRLSRLSLCKKAILSYKKYFFRNRNFENRMIRNIPRNQS